MLFVIVLEVLCKMMDRAVTDNSLRVSMLLLGVGTLPISYLLFADYSQFFLMQIGPNWII